MYFFKKLNLFETNDFTFFDNAYSEPMESLELTTGLSSDGDLGDLV